MGDIRLVVFDWAGTVIDFGCRAPTGAFVAAFAELCAEAGQGDAADIASAPAG